MCEIYDDADMCDVWEERQVRARKSYRCSECGGQIESGSHHRRIDTLYEGSWDHHRVCEPCWDLWTRFSAEHGNRIVLNTLEETLSECVDYSDESAERWKRDLEAMRERRRAAA